MNRAYMVKNYVAVVQNRRGQKFIRAGRSGDHLMTNEPHQLGPRVAGTQTRYCFNPAHGTPCPLPCRQCRRECPRTDWEDTAINRQRTLEWEARKPR